MSIVMFYHNNSSSVVNSDAYKTVILKLLNPIIFLKNSSNPFTPSINPWVKKGVEGTIGLCTPLKHLPEKVNEQKYCFRVNPFALPVRPAILSATPLECGKPASHQPALCNLVKEKGLFCTISANAEFTVEATTRVTCRLKKFCFSNTETKSSLFFLVVSKKKKKVFM